MTTDAPPVGAGFGGSSREVEVKHENEISIVTIPLKVAFWIGVLCNVITLLVYLGGVLLWARYRTGWGPWHRALWEWLGKAYPFLAAPLILEWCAVLGLLIAQFVRKTINPNWPPPTSAVDFEVSGYATRPGRGQVMVGQPPPDDGVRVVQHKLEIRDPDTRHRRLAEFNVPADLDENFQDMCRAIAKQNFFSPHFSKSGAKRFHIPWEVFRQFQVEFIARGLAWQEPSRNGSGKVHLHHGGIEACRELSTPPPQF